jgi:hypothetical protein
MLLLLEPWDPTGNGDYASNSGVCVFASRARCMQVDVILFEKLDRRFSRQEAWLIGLPHSVMMEHKGL